MKIAIVTRQMIIGGVEKALIGMLRVMNSNDEVDLYVEQFGGELFEELPDWVNVIQIPQKKWDVLRNGVFIIIKALRARLELHFCKEYVKQCELSVRSFPIIAKEYDMAIAYHAPNTIPVFYVIHNLKAKKKVLWLHGDVETNHMIGELARQYYNQYDKVFAVSKQSKKIFDKHFPELSQRSEVFYNIVDAEYLKKQAEKAPTYTDGFDGTRILTIGRLDFQKGIDLAIEVCKRLIDDGISVRWYICGEGNERRRLEQKIADYSMQEHFILLGNQLNPYGYLRDCDIYVQPSRFEGYCTASNEAKVFGKTVIVTDVCGMREQFENGKTGIICDIDETEIHMRVKFLIEQSELNLVLTTNAKFAYRESKIEKLYQVVTGEKRINAKI